MAADRAKTGLMIALIIFVMITFILAVTTYIGFQQRDQTQRDSEAADERMRAANVERDAAIEQERRVRAVIGTDKDTAEAIELEMTEMYDRRFDGFKAETKTLLRLVDWLADAIKAKDEELKRIEAEQVQDREEQRKAVAEAQKRQQEAEDARDAAVKQQADQKADFDRRWTQHEQALKDMRAEQDKALAAARQMQAIITELDKLEQVLSGEQRLKFSAAQAPERVGVVKDELLSRERSIKLLNATLAQLRVADPELQELVRESTPADDRIDGFDGRIATVHAFDRTVLVVCDSTAGMRPGLLLAVYDPDDPRPRIGARKGMIEVIGVEGPTLARARVIRDSAASPILAGDGVATSLWAPDTDHEVVIVGAVRFGAGRGQDAAALAAFVERHGGTVVDAVTPQTALVVDAGVPRQVEGQAGRGKDWRPADETARKNALARAKELGIRVVTLDGLLDMLGVDRELLDGRRLPHELGAGP